MLGLLTHEYAPSHTVKLLARSKVYFGVRTFRDNTNNPMGVGHCFTVRAPSNITVEFLSGSDLPARLSIQHTSLPANGNSG